MTECTEYSTHHAGCQCHEARRDAGIQKLRNALVYALTHRGHKFDYDEWIGMCNDAGIALRNGVPIIDDKLRYIKEVREHGCECSDDDACRVARDRDAARAEVERLQERLDAARLEIALQNDVLDIAKRLIAALQSIREPSVHAECSGKEWTCRDVNETLKMMLSETNWALGNSWLVGHGLARKHIQLRSALALSRSALKTVEWRSVEWEWCPVCDSSKTCGHESYCELTVALKGIDDAQGDDGGDKCNWRTYGLRDAKDEAKTGP